MRHLRSARDDERGAVSTETAIVAAILVAVAIAMGAILIPKTENIACAIPDDSTGNPGSCPAGGSN